MKDVMIDLETLSTKEDAAIVQIGACYFDRHLGASKSINDKFMVNIDFSTLNDSHIDPKTVLFWLQQPKEAQNSITQDQLKVSLKDGLEHLNTFIGKADYIWCHTTFDFKILQFHLNRLNISPNFRFSSARDLRTLVDLAKYNYKNHPFEGTKHTALDDCLWQISYSVECFKRLNKNVK